MFEVTVEAGFSSGHYLRNYRGKCENPHGHNYKVFVTLVGEHLDEAGMLLDFKLLKQVMRPTVEYLDHRMINELEPFVTEINPSAENLAKYFYEQTSVQLKEMTQGRVRVKDCTLYETDTSFARYYE
jgi:6-pyruvoyltetrahydropterin/6-carboxytetrahydropterin synthase